MPSVCCNQNPPNMPLCYATRENRQKSTLVFDHFHAIDIILKIFFSGVVDLTSAETNVSQDSGFPGRVSRCDLVPDSRLENG